MKNQWRYKVISVIAGLLLLYPAFNGVTRIVEEKGLDGAVVLAEDVPFSFRGWWDGTWQMQKEKYLNDHFGFRAFFVRLKHELDYRLFKKIHAKDVLIGKEGYLYEGSYIRSYCGKDFVGRDSIAVIVGKIREAQQIFEKKGILFLTVIAPGKASFYPDYFPDSLDNFSGKPTNYTVFSKEAALQQLNLIDFSAYFRSMKETSKYCLYPKNGIHWSYYAMYLAMDSIAGKIESAVHLKLPRLRLEKMNVEEEKEQDYDLARGMNLLFHLPGFKMGYPELRTDESGVEKKLSSLVIADSFFWGLYNMGFGSMFSTTEFWYYNYQIFPETSTPPDGVPMKDVVRDKKVIIILATEQNIYYAGWGFVYRALNELRDAE